MLTDMLSDMTGLVKLFVIIFLCVGANLVLMIMSVSIRRKISPITLVKKLLPSFLVALTTASSAATFSTNME